MISCNSDSPAQPQISYIKLMARHRNYSPNPGRAFYELLINEYVFCLYNGLRMGPLREKHYIFSTVMIPIHVHEEARALHARVFPVIVNAHVVYGARDQPQSPCTNPFSLWYHG